MVRDDDRFLRLWVAYYGAAIGRENLYVWFDGLDQAVPDFCDGMHVGKIEHVVADVHEGDRRRIDYLSARAADLFAEGYELVIGTDVDEFLAVDPSCGVTLAEFLSSVETAMPSISGLGVDVGQKVGEEAEIDWDRPLLSQRSYAKLSTRYSKATVLTKPIAWGSGFHRTRNGNFHIVKDLYLFHFGCVDLARLLEKMGEPGLVSEGWSRHLGKRAATIDLVGKARARDFDKTVRWARRVQNAVRPPYAWNKPAMFELKIVVRIPDRFYGLV